MIGQITESIYCRDNYRSLVLFDFASEIQTLGTINSTISKICSANSFEQPIRFSVYFPRAKTSGREYLETTEIVH